MEQMNKKETLDILDNAKDERGAVPMRLVRQAFDKLPTIQPVATDTNVGDTISRQAALDAFGFSEKTRKYGGDHSGYNTMMLYEIQGILEGLPSAQLEEAIPVSWIESRIERFMMAGDAFSGLTASIIRVILNEWEKEQEGGTDGSDL